MAHIKLRDDIEYSIHSDNKGNIIGPISKIHAHTEGVRANLTHYSTWSMIYHLPSGKYGIQLKSSANLDKLTAGKWDIGVAGHNIYQKQNDNYVPLDFSENLKKEAKEEIGINLKMFEDVSSFVESAKEAKEVVGFIFDKFHYKTEKDNEWVGLGFVAVPTQNVVFVDDEVADFKWLTPDELQNFIDTETNYCSILPLVFKKAEKFISQFF